MVIADGHHRFETALAYQEERRAATGGRAGDYDLMMALIVELADEQLSVRAIHRLISGLPDGFDLVGGAVPAPSTWSPTDPPDADIGSRMLAAGSLALMTPDGTWLARPQPRARRRLRPTDLDSSRLDVALAALPPHELTYQHGWDLAAAAVAKGTAQAAVLLRPASVDQIAATGPGRRADAAQDHVLLAEAPHRAGVPRGRRLTEPERGPPSRAALYDWECREVLGRTDQDVEFWLDVVGDAPPGPVLELACGTGRVTIPLAAGRVDDRRPRHRPGHAGCGPSRRGRSSLASAGRGRHAPVRARLVASAPSSFRTTASSCSTDQADVADCLAGAASTWSPEGSSAWR